MAREFKGLSVHHWVVCLCAHLVVVVTVSQDVVAAIFLKGTFNLILKDVISVSRLEGTVTEMKTLKPK